MDLPPKYLGLPSDVQARIASLLKERDEIMQRVKRKRHRAKGFSRAIIRRAKVYAKYSPVKSRARITAERMKMKHTRAPIPMKYEQRLTAIQWEIDRLTHSMSTKKVPTP